MSVPTAKDMADALRQTGAALFGRKLIESHRIFYGLAQSIVSGGNGNLRWAYEITESNPIEFRRIHNARLDKFVRPRIYASISVQQSPTGGVCFEQLDLALEIIDDESNVLIKHHIDLANASSGQFQNGPLFHLQFGGHTPGHSRAFEVPIKEPRWLCIPLDVVLLCEVVVANFYPEDWEGLKELSGWHDPIVASQKLCVIPFLEALNNKASASDMTLLDHLWAQKLGPSYMQNGFP